MKHIKKVNTLTLLKNNDNIFLNSFITKIKVVPTLPPNATNIKTFVLA